MEPRAPGLPEPGRYDDQRMDALGRAVTRHVEHGIGRNRDDREVQVAGDVAHRAVRDETFKRSAAGVDRVHVAA